VLLSRRDFDRLAAQAQKHTEDEYWTQSAIRADADSRVKREQRIPFKAIEKELDARP
jgi:hypothetical protein